jgi:hypothetical protein
MCLAGFTAACSAQAPADGTLTGHLYDFGGPLPPGASNSTPQPVSGTVTVTGPGVHCDVPVGASGTYSVMVPAGKYTVTGGNGNQCQAAGVATVASGHTTKADVWCLAM